MKLSFCESVIVLDKQINIYVLLIVIIYINKKLFVPREAECKSAEFEGNVYKGIKIERRGSEGFLRMNVCVLQKNLFEDLIFSYLL